MVKDLPDNAADIRDRGMIPGSRRSPGGGPGNPLQYSSLENPMDREAWQDTAHRVTENWMPLKNRTEHTPSVLEMKGKETNFFKCFCKHISTL